MTRKLLLLTGLFAAFGPARHTGNSLAGPAGLPLSEWAQIRALHDKHRHSAVLAEGQYRARNPRQGWLTRFDGRGFTVTPDGKDWEWGLELRGHGARALVTAKDERVSYRWSRDVEEWFVNSKRGLEHGFAIRSRPAGEAGSLRLTFRIRGGLSPSVDADGRGVRFGDAVRYDGLTAWDAAGKLLAARFARRTGNAFEMEVDDRGAVYPITVDPIAQQRYLKPNLPEAGDSFGFSASLSGDTLVMGAFGDDSSSAFINGDPTDNGAPMSGAAYVFVRTNGVWSQQAYLKASNAQREDRFGTSVSVSGETIVVGAPFEDSDATGVDSDQGSNRAQSSGAAYVFVRFGPGFWTQQAYLKPSNTAEGDGFGSRVAVSGDTVVVGASGEDSNARGVSGDQTNDAAANSGAAYVFSRTNNAWSQSAYLKASDARAGDSFGASIAMSGDTVAIGAAIEDRSGAVYVFQRSGNWFEQGRLRASNAQAGDEFGVSVAVSGDTLVVGAYREDSNATGVNGSQFDDNALESGAAYVFKRSNGSWAQQAYLKASNTGANDLFGFSVAVHGDTILVGATLESSSATGIDGDQSNNGTILSGACYLFAAEGNTWIQQAYIKASNTGFEDFFGTAVSVSGGSAVVGSPNERSGSVTDQSDNSAAQAGAGYVSTSIASSLMPASFEAASSGSRMSMATAPSLPRPTVGSPSAASPATSH